MLSSNSYSAKEAAYTTIGLFQVQVLDCVLKHNALTQIFQLTQLSLLMVQGNEVGIKYLKNQILTDVKKPSVIAEFNMVKFQIFFRDSVLPQQVTGQHFANTLILVFIPAVDERNET